MVSAVKEYDKLKKDTAHYYVDWISIDGLGNALFTSKRYEDAWIIFEKNAAKFPTRDIALISLAKVYQMLGRKEDAITYYKKAIAVNKGNEEAKNKLKDLERDK